MSHRKNLVAAIVGTGVARAVASLEYIRGSGDDCNEGSDGKKGRDVDEHVW